VLGVRKELRATDRIRTGTARITTSDAAVTPRPPRVSQRGRPDSNRRGLARQASALPLSYAPEWRGWDSNPRSRAHEAREDSLSSTALRWCRSGRQESNLRSPAPETGGVATLRHDQPISPVGVETGTESSGGRNRTCASRLTAVRLAARLHRNETEAAGLEPVGGGGPPPPALAVRPGRTRYGSLRRARPPETEAETRHDARCPRSERSGCCRS
jgi:hypothetical protein